MICSNSKEETSKSSEQLDLGSLLLEIQFRETSADTERIKYNTNGIKTGSSKNTDLPKVKKRHS